MSLEIKVQRVSEGQTQKGKPKTGLYDGKQWVNVFGHFGAKAGDTVIVKPSGITNWYEFEFKKEPEPSSKEANGDEPPDGEPVRGKLKWPEYMALVQAAHALAMSLEPDGYTEDGTKGIIVVDRSSARHAILNTILMQYTRGAFEYPEIPF